MEFIAKSDVTQNPLKGIYFHSGGGYFGFYIGVAKRMIELGTKSEYSRFVSCSAGNFGSMVLHMFHENGEDLTQNLLEIDHLVINTLGMALDDIKTTSSVLSFLSPIGGLDLTQIPERLEFRIREYIENGMGNEEFLRRVKNMEIVVTPISTMRPVIVSNFNTMDEFMAAMFASLFIPIIMGMPRKEVGGQLCIDGGFPYTVLGNPIEYLDSETEWMSVRVHAWIKTIDPLFKMGRADGTKSLSRIYDMDFHKENIQLGYDAAVNILN